ncbi:MAG: V-type ATP synthase subunit E [Thermoplasmata archaeon]|nr:V-type ATP synthase subunit E [Thermoplasmata archaeon]
MGLEKLLDEIRQRGESQLSEIGTTTAAARAALVEDRDRRVAAIAQEIQRLADREAERERAQRLAGAKVAARKLVYEAKEQRATAALERARTELAAFTKSPEYAPLLQRMYAHAVERLGAKVKVRGRAEDASVLKGIAGKGFNDDPAPVLGGLIAESPDAAKRLNLTLDELLRLNEDKIRQTVDA